MSRTTIRLKILLNLHRIYSVDALNYTFGPVKPLNCSTAFINTSLVPYLVLRTSGTDVQCE